MKYLAIIIASLMFVASGCGKQQSASCVPPQTIELDCNGDGVVESAELKEYIEGDFNGDGSKEYAALYAYKQLRDADANDSDYYKYDHYYYVAFGDASIPMIDLDWSGAHLTNEGDLNGDGAEDIGLLNWGGYSTWNTYVVYVYYEQEWQDLISVSHSEDWNYVSYNDLLRPDADNPGCVIAREVRHDGKVNDTSMKLPNTLLSAALLERQAKRVEEIENELVAMFQKESNMSWMDSSGSMSKSDMQLAIEDAMFKQLKNPLTLSEDMPNLAKEVGIIDLPKSGMKIYSYFVDGGGTMSEGRNFLQMLTRNDDICVVPLWNNMRYPRTIVDAWEVEIGGDDYIAIKSYWRGSSGSWWYYLDVICPMTVIYYNPQFFPEGVGSVTLMEECSVYDRRGEYVDWGYMKSGHICVCGTENCNTNVDFDFDPETLTVKVRDDGDSLENRTGAVIEREWQLVVPQRGRR